MTHAILVFSVLPASVFAVGSTASGVLHGWEIAVGTGILAVTGLAFALIRSRLKPSTESQPR